MGLKTGTGRFPKRARKDGGREAVPATGAFARDQPGSTRSMTCTGTALQGAPSPTTNVAAKVTDDIAIAQGPFFRVIYDIYVLAVQHHPVEAGQWQNVACMST